MNEKYYGKITKFLLAVKGRAFRERIGAGNVKCVVHVINRQWKSKKVQNDYFNLKNAMFFKLEIM